MSLNEFDKALARKGYGTLSADGTILNLDNYWRKEHSESEGFDWFGLNPGSKAYWQKGFKVHYEDYYEPNDGFAFNFLPKNLISIDSGILLLMARALGPTGFERLLSNIVTSVTSLLNKVLDSGRINAYMGLNAQVLWAALAHRFSLINDGGYLKIVDQTRNIISVLQQLATAGVALSGLESLTEGTSEVLKAMYTPAPAPKK